MIKYYKPKKGLIDYLEKELQVLDQQTNNKSTGVGKNYRFVRNKDSSNNVARLKNHYMNYIMQAFTDIIYFLEFIEANYDKANYRFEEDLTRLLLGPLSQHPADEFKENPSHYNQDHYENSGPPLQRFIDAMLLSNNHKKVDPQAYQSSFLRLLIECSLQALYLRFSSEELQIVSDDCRRVRFWANYLAKPVKD